MTFTSLDFMLHMEALLSTINFLSAALSVDGRVSTDREIKPKTEEKTVSKSCQYIYIYVRARVCVQKT